MKGHENFVSMMMEKNRIKQKRMEEIDDFKANYTQDLIQKWN